MTFKYNGTMYTVEAESTYKEIVIAVKSLNAACNLINAVNGMTSYDFNLVSHSGMVVKRRQINIDGNRITVRIIMREQTEIEKIRSAISELDVSEEDAAKHPVLFPDINEVDTVSLGQYYRINGEVRIITEIIEEDAEPQIVSREAKGGK